ncbi:MAG: hypothetical protein HY677_06795 [Chloroflexi bacterium]|nr:hypothetical protein [Chloroflexota bacterium]
MIDTIMSGIVQGVYSIQVFVDGMSPWWAVIGLPAIVIVLGGIVTFAAKVIDGFVARRRYSR